MGVGGLGVGDWVLGIGDWVLGVGNSGVGYWVMSVNQLTFLGRRKYNTLCLLQDVLKKIVSCHCNRRKIWKYC
ncbi:hypothetical protein DQQ10_18750 [Pseudochryseolinea flava]|uniref:Uncharacterized protein n=1 Tax=Pseudochryseolinea flava TaxID=2059302 RepID=A0A364Y129_9BACT|nr:hypothetical protein DQQ10_18750 [Pseudochryseolinea flava]